MSDRSEKPTAKRRRKAEEQGQVVRSREVAAACALIAATVYLGLVWRPLMAHAESLLKVSISLPVAYDSYWPVGSALYVCMRDLSAVSAVTLCASAAAMLLQHPKVSLSGAKLLTFKQMAISTNVKRIVTTANILKTLKGALSGLVIAVVGIGSMRHVIFAPQPGHSAQIALEIRSVLEKCLVVLALDAALAYLYERRKNEASLRMTKQEVREEAVETEGNPHVRARIRRLQRQFRKGWRAQDVKRATVVLVNPTHVAVALEYGTQSTSVPTVLAKGIDEAALKIREIANWHEVPIVESVQLARELYKTCDVGQRIPQKLYAAVAQVLALVYRTDAKVRTQQAAASSL